MITIIIPLSDEKYQDYINRILNARDNKKNNNEYQELHHIIPKCLNGTDDKENLVYLYPQEHYYAHKLLALENPSNQGLQFAWWNMCHCKKAGKDNDRTYQISSDEYAEAKKRFSVMISEKLSGENAYWYGKKQSEESNKKRSEKLSGENNPMYGKNHSQSVKNFISQLNKGQRMGEKHPRARKVRCINTGEIFNTATEAAQYCSLKSRSSITLCCKGNKDSAGKHPITGERLHWEYVDVNN